MKTRIQLALDSMNLDNAIRLVDSAIDYMDWIEVSNSLLKGEGLHAVRRVKDAFPEKRVLVDMKFVSSGQEIEAASRFGADVVILSDNKDDRILKGFVDVAKINGVEIMIELRDIEEISSRWKFLENAGVDYILLNSPRPADELRKIREFPEITGIPVAINTGTDSVLAERAVKSGASVIVVGRGMADGDEIQRATTEIKGLVNSVYQEEGCSAMGDYMDLDSIAADLDRIKDVMTRLHKEKSSEEKRRSEIERELERIMGENEMERREMDKERKRLDSEVRKLEEQRRTIGGEWERLKEAENRWSEEQKSREEEYRMMQESVWEEWEGEQRKRWKEWVMKRNQEREDMEKGMKKISEAMEEIEGLGISLGREREKIETEWKRIEGEMRRIEESRKEIKDREAKIARDKDMINRLVKDRGKTIVAFPKLASRISSIYKEKERELREIEKEKEGIKKERASIEKEWRAIQEGRRRIEEDMKLMEREEKGASGGVSGGWKELERIKSDFMKYENSDMEGGGGPDMKERRTSDIVNGLSRIEQDLLRLKKEHEGR